jgi:hypothetical protein
MSNNNNNEKIDNRIDLSKVNYKRKPKEEEPIHFEPTYLSQLFHKPTDDDPVERQKAREALFRSLKEDKQTTKPPSSDTFTK